MSDGQTPIFSGWYVLRTSMTCVAPFIPLFHFRFVSIAQRVPFHLSTSTMTSPDRCSEAQLRRAAGWQSLDTLKEALVGWTADEIDKNDTSSPGKSALHMAAWKGCIENVQHLFEVVGCNVNAYSQQEFSYGKTAVFFAATQSRQDVLEYLLSSGAKVTIVNNKGRNGSKSHGGRLIAARSSAVYGKRSSR